MRAVLSQRVFVEKALIMGDLMRVLDEGRSPILLTERRDHLKYFAERLRNTNHRFTVLRGGMRVKERRELCSLSPRIILCPSPG